MPVIIDPKEIKAKSFEMIDKFLAKVKLPKREKEVTRRVIHATARRDYAKDLLFHPQAVKAGLKAIRAGKSIVVDAKMVRAGIMGKTICFIGHKDIIRRSSQLKITRAALAMRKAKNSMSAGIVAVGNAPTGLFEVCDLVEKLKIKPALIVGLPVGFVGAKEAKKRLLGLKIPYITNRTRYGGSAAAAAAVNALLKIAAERR